MKIQHLRFLVAVVDYDGVIKAAKRLHLSQPAISAGLKALEQELGRSLFDRSGPGNRPLRLTPAGRRFYSHAVEILRQCDAARAELENDAVSGCRLRIGVLDTLPQDAIANMLQLLAERAPKVRLELWEGSGERVAGWFVQERIEIAWTNVNDLMPNTRLLWREPLVAVMAPTHPLVNTGGRIAIRDLDQQPFVHRSRCELDAVGRAQLRGAAVTLNVIARAEREDLAYRLVREGSGITLAPESLVPDDLIAMSVSGLSVARVIGLQWHGTMDRMVLATITGAADEVVSMMESRIRVNA